MPNCANPVASSKWNWISLERSKRNWSKPEVRAHFSRWIGGSLLYRDTTAAVAVNNTVLVLACQMAGQTRAIPRR